MSSTDTDTDTDTDLEPLEDFRQRARTWLAENFPRHDDPSYEPADDPDEDELRDLAHQRSLQRKLFDGGFAGIIFPKEYGGQGLTPEHQQVFNEEVAGYQYPSRIQVPTFTPCATIILDFGTEEQKQEHIPAILRGDELWMQFLSEPSGGSDVAGAQTTAMRDGDGWILNGSKVWTTGAWWSDWGLCLARTNWDVPKHRGLTVFMLPIHQEGIEVHRIEMLNGSKEFCQEFITDVWIPDGDRIGDVDDGWTVGTRWMSYEKSFMMSFHTTRPADGGGFGRMSAWGGTQMSPIATARRVGLIDDAATRERIGEAHALSLASDAGSARVAKAIGTGHFSHNAAGLARVIRAAIAFGGRSNIDMAGSSLVAWEDEDEVFGNQGQAFLSRQAGMMAGGTIEMARNVVAERFLGMPRELSLDRGVPFREVPKGPPSTT